MAVDIILVVGMFVPNGAFRYHCDSGDPRGKLLIRVCDAWCVVHLLSFSLKIYYFYAPGSKSAIESLRLPAVATPASTRAVPVLVLGFLLFQTANFLLFCCYVGLNDSRAS